MIHVPRLYSLPATTLVVDQDHVVVPPEVGEHLPAHLEVEVQGLSKLEATREGELLSGRNLGEYLRRIGGLVQMEVGAGYLRFRNALTVGNGLAVNADRVRLADPTALLRQVSKGDFCDPERFFLAREAAEVAVKPGFDQLLSQSAVQGVTTYQHQLNTVKTVLRSMRGRALLCDEVGLGKTIEAGLVLLEYLLRGQVKRVLILTPPSVIYQWREEMAQKFNLDFVLSDSPEFKTLGPEAWTRFDRIIASLSQAKRSAHLERVQQTSFDMVIVDEAHYLRNRETRAWQLVNGLDKKYILLLTATPVQNDLEELFNLITLLKPGLLKTAGEFRRRFVVRGDRLKPQNVAELQRLVSQVMVRNRRSTAGVDFTQRHAYTVRVEPTSEEVDLRRQVTDLVRLIYPHLVSGSRRPAEEHSTPISQSISQEVPSRQEDDGGMVGEGVGDFQPGNLNRLALKTLQMEMGSSPAALIPTVERLLSHDLPAPVATRLREIRQAARATGDIAKLTALLQTLRRLRPDDKVLIFTGYLGTLGWLRQQLSDWKVAIYHGGLRVREKDEVVESFRRDCQVMLSTDAGGEGRNLQFCNVLVNFDLPWNPMRIEQRIGRLSRIGQPRDVHVFNLCSVGSIEEQIVEVLDRKINLFELVVGELDLILGRLEDERDLEDVIMDLVGNSASDEEARQQIDELGEKLKGLRQDYLRVKTLDDVLFQEVGGE